MPAFAGGNADQNIPSKRPDSGPMSTVKAQAPRTISSTKAPITPAMLTPPCALRQDRTALSSVRELGTDAPDAFGCTFAVEPFAVQGAPASPSAQSWNDTVIMQESTTMAVLLMPAVSGLPVACIMLSRVGQGHHQLCGQKAEGRFPRLTVEKVGGAEQQRREAHGDFGVPAAASGCNRSGRRARPCRYNRSSRCKGCRRSVHPCQRRPDTLRRVGSIHRLLILAVKVVVIKIRSALPGCRWAAPHWPPGQNGTAAAAVLFAAQGALATAGAGAQLIILGTGTSIHSLRHGRGLWMQRPIFS